MLVVFFVVCVCLMMSAVFVIVGGVVRFVNRVLILSVFLGCVVCPVAGVLLG